MTPSTTEKPQINKPVTSFLSRHGQKLIALAFWLLLLGSYWYYVTANDLTLADSVENLAVLLTTSAFGPLLYIIIYWLRPLIFFPATVLTVLGGFLFGPIGIIYTIIGANGSAMVAFAVGYFFGQGVLKDNEDSAGFIQKYTTRMRENSFETVLLMRLIFLPYDLVNYSAGFLRIKWLPFLLATAVGSLPGTISFVLLGASFGTLDEMLAGELKVNPPVLVSSIALIVVSIGFSRLLKRREATKNNA
ncbi:MAG: TVP38/TMEM64 family protein [Anaerolineae bacterium]|nr:TVP38/TMEM64 family protein [Anaerolineae bacterium]